MIRFGLIRYARSGDGPDTRRPAPVTIFVNNAFAMGGTTRASLNLAEYLAHDRAVEIVSTFRRRKKPFFAFSPGVRVTVLEDRHREAHVPWLGRVLMRQPSVLTHRGEQNYGAWSLLTDVRFARMLRRRRGVLIATKPGLNMLLVDVAPPAAARIGQEHVHLRARRPRVQRAIAARYPHLDSLVVLTETDRRRYEELLARPLRIDVIPNAVRPLGGPPGDVDAARVLSVGRFTSQKGYDLLIPAYARVAARHPSWRLRICGKGELRPGLAQLVERHALADVVQLAPPARSVGTEMSRASIFALSSRFEGFPLVLLEAMSKRLAVVAFDCPTGPSDVIEDGRNGLLVPAEDIGALAEAIHRLISDRNLRDRLAAAAAATAQEFTMEAIGPRWQALLRELA